MELASGLTNYQLGGLTWRTLTLNAREGEQWGLLVGKKIAIHEGTVKRIIDEHGTYVVEDNKTLGSDRKSVV